jgi:hypothetical protein
MFTRCAGVCAVVALALGAAEARAGDAGGEQQAGGPTVRRRLTVPRAAAPVRVDAVLDDEAWRGALRVDLPWEVAPGNNTPARVATRCAMVLGDDTLYFGCDADDPAPSGIRAFYADRDDTASQDQLGLVLDTFNDARRAYMFTLTPLGVQADGIFDQQRLEDHPEWDAIWTSAGRLTATGYVVEAAIPLRALRFGAGADPQTWGFYFWRIWPRSEHVQTRSAAADPRGNCALCTAEWLTGLSDLEPGGRFDATPTLTGTRTDRRTAEEGTPDAGDASVEAGLDGRWGITSDLSLNVTINPDFSHVEADAAQLDVNNRFAISFPEKRRFFLEGADVFRTPVEAVFTRTIADPSFGAKLTGRVGATGLGVIVARDAVTNVVVPGLTGSRTVSTAADGTTLVARARRDLAGATTIGGLVTMREAGGYGSELAAIDGEFRPVRALTVSVQALASATRGGELAPDDPRTRRGFAGHASGRFTTRSWNVQAAYDLRSPDFRADAGFVTQVGYTRREITVRRIFWGRPDGWLTRFTLGAAHWPLDDRDGRLQGRWQYVSAEYVGPWQSRLALYARRRTEVFQGVRYDFYTPYYGLALQPSGALSVVVNAYMGRDIAYDYARLAHLREVHPSVTARVGRHLDARVSYMRQTLTDRGVTLLDADVAQIRAVYTFTTRAFVRAIVERRGTTRLLEPAATHARTTSLLSQLLFSYKINPETAVFVGYGDDYLDDGVAAGRPARLEQISRTLFFKVGYAFRPPL